MDFFFILITSLRFLSPFFIFSFPFATVTANILLDMVDAIVLNKLCGFKWEKYQLFDKIFDAWWYLFIFLFIVICYNEIIYALFLVILFGWRMVGETLFFLTKKRYWLFFCPNLFEPIFWVWVTLFHFASLDIFTPGFFVFSLFITILLKMPWEYFLHYCKIEPVNFVSRKIFKKDIFYW